MIDQYIQKYGRRLYGLCRSLCASPYDADDLYQETWLRVVKHISQYDPSREFEPWLTRICVNTYRSILRRLAKSPLLDFSNGDEKDRLLASIPAPEKTDYALLYEAVGQLPEKLRLAVVLFYFQGGRPGLRRQNPEHPGWDGKIPAEQGSKIIEGGACR